VIGDPVNVASRLEPLGKIYGAEIVVGEDTLRAAGDRIVVRRLDRVAVYGRMQGLAIYELLALADGENRARAPWVEIYEAGLAAYEGRQWAPAIRLFEAAAASRGGTDRASEVLIARCRSCLADPPPDGWMAVSVIGTK
jgi:adenylate cyclase